MTTSLIPLNMLSDSETANVPTLFRQSGEKATRRVLEFFLAEIRNMNTRTAYAQALVQFDRWCQERHLHLEELCPFHVAAYIEELGQKLAKPSVKQHLAALRVLFDYLIVGQIVPSNPAASVRGPKYVVKKGKTPVLTRDEAKILLESIEDSTHIGLRDRALISVMIYSFARVSAVVGMNVEDYWQQGLRRCWIRLNEKGGKAHEVPAHHKAEEYLDAYLSGIGIAEQKGKPLFRSINRRRQLTARRLDRREVFEMVRRRTKAAGLGDRIACHSFRATGITVFMQNGGSLEMAQKIAAHESPRTTKLYDRTADQLTLDEIERILI